MNDHAFQDIIGSDFQNVFKKVIELNMEHIKSKDMLLYLKLKYMKAVQVMEADNELEKINFKDRTTGKIKQKSIDHIGNLKKAE